ncbi:MAG: hypothetical protein AAGF81_06990 [Pseudomonadota bacterium]
MFADSRATRWIGLGVLSAIALVSGVFFYVLDQPERREAAAPGPDQTIAEVEEVTRKLETARFALKPQDIALLKSTLRPGEKVAWSSTGDEQQAVDFSSWTLTGEIKNLSPEHAAQDVSLRARLFDCPAFFTTPIDEVQISRLTSECNMVGQRTVGLYGVKLGPGLSHAFTETIEFIDQIEPRNWRFWVDVTGVTASVQ